MCAQVRVFVDQPEAFIVEAADLLTCLAFIVPQRTALASWGCLLLQAPGCAAHSGQAAQPLSARREEAAVQPSGPADVADSAAFEHAGLRPPPRGQVGGELS